MSEKLSKTGLQLVWAKIKENFVAKEDGKGLSTNDFTTDYKTKLDGIAEGAQVNVIETVKVNDVALTPDEKVVNIIVPTGALASLDNVAETNLDSELATKINSKADSATTLAGYGITDAYTKTEVDTMVSAVYKVKGTIAFADIPTTGQTTGDVYNISDAFTADDKFVTADQGKEFPAGTNIVWTDDSWDCLAGTYDFSEYALKTELPADISETEIDEICVL